MKKRHFRSDTNGQMIVIMGVMMVVSIIVLASLAAEISDLDIVVSHDRALNLLDEFTSIKEAFGDSLNYDLVNVTVMRWIYRSLLFGDISDIAQTFNRTRDSYFNLSLKHGLLFDAKLNDYWYFYPANNGDVYYADVTLYLSDGKTSITQDEVFTIIVRPVI